MKIAGLALPPPIAAAIRTCRPHFRAAMLFSLGVNILFLAPALYMLQVYDRVVPTAGTVTLLYVSLALTLALVVLAVLDGIRNRLLQRAAVRLDKLLTPEILARMMSASRSRHSVQAMRDFDTVRQTVGSPVTAALLDLPWTPIFILVSFLLHPLLGALAIVSAAVLLFLAYRNERSIRGLMQEAGESLALSYASQQAASLHSGTIRALGMIGPVVARQSSERTLALADLFAAQLKGGRYSSLIKFFRLFVQSAALGLGALLAINGQISAGAIVAASILLSRALQPIEILVGGWAALSMARSSLANLAELFNSVPDIHDVRTVLPRPEGRMELEQVSVRSPKTGKAVLAGISFRLEPGEVLGVVGPSGSGKTTLAKVAAGSIRPDLGCVRVDGAAWDQWDSDELAQYVGYMPQEPSLLDGSVKDNISRFALWRGAVAAEVDAAVVAAAKMAGIHELILQLPDGYDTLLSGSSGGLSAGQAQRVALARALYGDPCILILDEPNAFLDTDGEAALARAIDACRNRGAAIIIVAHRPSILQLANHLLVLDAGRPRVLGPRNEVMARLVPPSEVTSAA